MAHDTVPFQKAPGVSTDNQECDSEAPVFPRCERGGRPAGD